MDYYIGVRSIGVSFRQFLRARLDLVEPLTGKDPP
jgi:hypothetical protein